MSSAPYVRHITDITDAELSALVDILVAAFKGDRFGNLLFGNDLSLAPAQLRANIRGALINGAVHALAVGPEPADLRGVALWFPPGASVFSTPEVRAASGWTAFMESLPEALRTWWRTYLAPTIGALSTDALGEGFAHSAWHLHLFGVLPAFHGQGYARLLVEHVDRLAAETRSPLLVETTNETNVKIYTKLGFEAVRDIDITSDYGSAHMWLLVKRPAALASA
ncbi:hypothetical protein HYPSUDRAFT_414225 [Hypholoma sublateritium FD-334 SS-4]|uniref:N-acetyltransferase domain-containing protein n=1 Tax=Hypholoma sublateritium (strain FD-334 SS-4) TaxID=945553 RepID=A0A0D2NDZ7_HYPSF|nr:hypothetical protein HYPSUDRAFT_414225 [Hypholoma sublateritium FD-334 SS-4]